MAENTNKEILIKKYKDGSISPDELLVLKKYFKPENIPEELSGLFRDLWDNSLFINDEFDADSSWCYIARAIGHPEDQPEQSDKKYIRFRSIFRYAAVFILAFGVAWLIKSRPKSTAQENNTHFCKVEVSYGSKSKIILPDGTLVSLNSGSFIRYPSQFKKDSRDVYFEGEAYFDVKKDHHHPFTVTTRDVKIRVLGTTFNVKAYPEDEEVETTLITGRVEIDYTNPKGSGNKTIVLQPNQKVVIPTQGRDIDKRTEKQTTTPSLPVKNYTAHVENIIRPGLYTSWKDNILEFDNERFNDLMTRFERWYDVTIVNNYSEIKDARLSGKFEKETIEQALNALNLTIDFNYSMDKNIVTISKKK